MRYLYIFIGVAIVIFLLWVYLIIFKWEMLRTENKLFEWMDTNWGSVTARICVGIICTLIMASFILELLGRA